jgi:hypothetical protein
MKKEDWMTFATSTNSQWAHLDQDERDRIWESLSYEIRELFEKETLGTPSWEDQCVTCEKAEAMWEMYHSPLYEALK